VRPAQSTIHRGSSGHAALAARPSWAMVIRSFAAKGLVTLPPPALSELPDE
jgi:hypothetical protein